jgi:hypothetical protein
MGYYKSKFYYFKDLKHHYCDECVYNDKETYVLLENCNNEFPFYITALEQESKDIHKLYKKITYKLQSCSKIQERGEYNSKTYILLEPWRFCSLSSNMIGKIFETKTLQNLISGSINTMSKLTKDYEYDGYSLEHSFAPAVFMKDISFIKHILPDEIDKTDIIFIDSDYLSPSDNWKRVYNMRLNDTFCFKINDDGNVSNDTNHQTSDFMTQLFHMLAQQNNVRPPGNMGTTSSNIIKKSKRGRFILIKLNDLEHYTYYTIKTLDIYADQKLNFFKQHFPNLQVLLNYKCNPNFKIFVKIKEKLEFKNVIFNGNNIDLDDSELTEKDLIKKLKIRS